MARTETIRIDGMSGDTCVDRVVAALLRTSGVAIREVRLGAAEIDCAYPAAFSAARAAIYYAGFRARPPSAPGPDPTGAPDPGSTAGRGADRTAADG